MSSVLCHAIWEENIDKVIKLVSEGEDLNEQSENGYTPLMQAAEMENIEIAEFLIKSGAQINCAGYDECTPLHIAVDISIDGTIQNGGSPGDEPIDFILFLLENGANLGAQDINGKTPIDWAENYSSKKVVEFLQSKNS